MVLLLLIRGERSFPLDTRIWRDIPGYEGCYQASSDGLIRSVPRKDKLGRPHGGKILLPAVNKRWGRLQVGLCKDGGQRTWRVHNLVALAFIGIPPEGYVVNHKDGNKLNNRLENLEYVTQRENILHAHRLGLIRKSGEDHHSARLTRADVGSIREAWARGALGKDLSAQYGVARSQISRIVNGARWK